MNEVTKIHLGRQAFTISAAAHKTLREYLDAITKQVGDKDVVEEIELRMAELLTEHGIKDEKVVLVKDIDFLKAQLGDPSDFNEEPHKLEGGAEPNSKRLFRDTDNAMIAGVAAGLAKYTGIDALLIRILFVVGTIAWGGGILVYIALWLLVPEAKTSSEKLQMQGKQVTVGSLKEVAERADVNGAAARANRTIAGPINSIFGFIVKLIGVGLVVIGLSLILGLLAVGLYLLFHGNPVSDNLFPIGIKEHVLVYVSFAVAGLVSLFIILFGMAVFKRKWPVRAWLTGVLAGITFIGIVAGGALAADAGPHVRDRYNANVHTTVRTVMPFTSVNITGKDADINYQFSDKYYVSFNYYDHPDLGSIKTNVKNGTLLMDTSQFNSQRNCPTLCIPDSYNMVITVYSPNSLQPNFPKLPPGPAVYPDIKPYSQ